MARLQLDAEPLRVAPQRRERPTVPFGLASADPDTRAATWRYYYAPPIFWGCYGYPYGYGYGYPFGYRRARSYRGIWTAPPSVIIIDAAHASHW